MNIIARIKSLFSKKLDITKPVYLTNGEQVDIIDLKTQIVMTYQGNRYKISEINFI